MMYIEAGKLWKVMKVWKSSSAFLIFLSCFLTNWSNVSSCSSDSVCMNIKECVDSLGPRKTLLFPCSLSGVKPVKVCCPQPTEAPCRIKFIPQEHKNYNLFPHGRCGQSEGDRVINGKNATLGQFPWMAVLLYEGLQDKGKLEFKCGGTVINNRYIMTAAHCLLIQNWTLKAVRLSEHFLDQKEDCDPYCINSTEYSISKTIIHENYNTSNIKNDIALIRVSKPIVPTTDTIIRPICLPFHNEIKETNFTIAGWGKLSADDATASNILQFSKVHFTSIQRCNLQHSEHLLPLSEKTQICAEGFRTDVCKGDSGGPLMYTTNITYQVGIVSFGAIGKCGLNEAPSVYTRVDGYLDWILNNVEP